MPTYEITAPNGKTLEITGDKMPGENELDKIFSETGTNYNPDNVTLTGGVQKTVNLRPSNIVKSAKAGIQAPFQAGINALGNLINSSKDDSYYQGMEEDLSKIISPDSAAKIADFNREYNAPKPQTLKATYQDLKSKDNTPDWMIDLAALVSLPQAAPFKGFKGAQIANNALTGAYQGAIGGGLESLNQKGISQDILADVSKGSVMGGSAGGILGGMPIAANMLKKNAVKGLRDTVLNNKSKVLDYIFQASRLKPETIRQVIKPDSRALEMTRDEASIMLTDIVKNLQKAFGDVETKYAQPINQSLKKMMTYKDGSPKEYIHQPSLKKVDLYNTLDEIFESDAYTLSGNPRLNLANRQAGNVYTDIINLIEEAQGGGNTITGPELYDVMRNIKNKVKWDVKNPAEDVANQILERAYGTYSGKLKELHPAIKEPFKNFEELQKLKASEGVRKILQPPEADKVEGAATALKNNWSTMSKGSSSQNIKNLEDIMVKNGYEPFMDKVDDINAVEELEQMFRTGNPTVEAGIRTFLAKPILKTIRDFDRVSPNTKGRFSALKNLAPYFVGANGVIPAEQFR